MLSKKQQTVIISVIIAFLVLMIAVILYIKLSPSKVQMPLTDYYKVADQEVYVILEDKVYEKKGQKIDGNLYVDYDVVKNYLNKRFYWDNNENVLTYTTPSEIIKTDLDSKDYYTNKSKTSENYVITKLVDGKVYIALEFVKKYSNVKYDYFENPNRMVIHYNFKDKYMFFTASKSGRIRVDHSIKSEYLVDVKPGDVLLQVDQDEKLENGFCKVRTADGVIGYIKTNCLDKGNNQTLTSDFKEPEYSHITKDYKVDLVWNQVTNMTANNNVLNLLNNTKGVTTIAPTWFSVLDDNGALSSLASEKYVERAHSAGVEVWALCDDFNKNIDINKILSYSSKREKIINGLIAMAIRYNLDGINIDFEKISSDGGSHFVEFIRELSVKCRSNGIVLSVDNYVPSDFTAYYDRAEQGVVADYVIMMAYDEHYAGDKESGSVSSINFVKDGLKNSLAQVPAERLIMALPLYTRLWKETPANGGVEVTSQAYGMDAADSVLRQYGAKSNWDEGTGQNYAQFSKDGATYKMWLEDETSLDKKLQAVSEGNVAGIGFWKLGFDRMNVWNTIIKYVK